MSLQYTLIGSEEQSDANIVVFVPGNPPMVAHRSHPNFDKIVAGALAGDRSIVTLFDIAATVAQKFQRLSERVTTANGRLYLDGEEVNDSLTTQVLRFLDEGVEDWKPLVAFFENVQANPNEHSREQLYTWLAGRDFTITPDGMIVAYKGVEKGEDEVTGATTYLSIHSGKAIVDGAVVTGRIPTAPGSLVEMPRGEVQWDPASGCASGLHVGTFDYATTYGNTLLEVHVNPRDVVSVPTDSSAAKVRCCRYQIVQERDRPYYAPVTGRECLEEDEIEDDDFWGDGED